MIRDTREKSAIAIMEIVRVSMTAMFVVVEDRCGG